MSFSGELGTLSMIDIVQILSCAQTLGQEALQIQRCVARCLGGAVDLNAVARAEDGHGRHRVHGVDLGQNLRQIGIGDMQSLAHRQWSRAMAAADDKESHPRALRRA